MAFAAIHEKVRAAVTAGAMPLVIGGDHSVAIPAIHAVAESSADEAIGVIQLDAHVDTDVDIDGDPLSHGCVIRRIVEDGYVLGGNILQLGLRGFWPPSSQLDWASERHISWLTIEQAVQEPLLNAALDELRNRFSRVYLTIDLDALDPSFAPGVGTPEPGGFSTREVFAIVRAVCRRFEIVGADVVELALQLLEARFARSLTLDGRAEPVTWRAAIGMSARSLARALATGASFQPVERA
jgi:agmatinase